MLPLFKTFFFDKLPSIFKRRDTNKDADPLQLDRGTLERYLEIFGDELDLQVSDDIDDYLDIINPLISDSKFLNLNAYQVGNPPDIFQNEVLYRALLSNILAIYKVKGTFLSYEIFFKIMGFNVVITEIPLLTVIYDDNFTYDQTNVNYDEQCQTCSFYDIAFGTPNNAPVSQTTLGILRRAIFFVEPINAVLGELIQLLAFEDELNYCPQENLTLTNITVLAYDAAITYDAASTYDEETVGVPTIIIEQCDSPPLTGIDYWELENDFIIQ